MYVISKLILETNDVELIGSFNDLKSAKSKIYDLNDLDEVSYRDKKNRFFKVYKKGYFGQYEIFIYKILEVPKPEDVNIKQINFTK